MLYLSENKYFSVFNDNMPIPSYNSLDCESVKSKALQKHQELYETVVAQFMLHNFYKNEKYKCVHCNNWCLLYSSNLSQYM
jgi:hypothetical protein